MCIWAPDSKHFNLVYTWTGSVENKYLKPLSLISSFLRPEECGDSKERKGKKEKGERKKERKKLDKIASGEKDFDIDGDGTTTATTISNVDTMHLCINV